MNTDTPTEPHQILRRILGDEADEFVQNRIADHEIQQAELLLLNAGIDPNEVYEQAVDDIQLTERLMDQGIDPPRRLDRLSETEFSKLDDRQLESYLTAYGIDVPAMVTDVESHIKEQWHWFHWPWNWSIPSDFWWRPSAIAATLALCVVAVGGGLSLTLFRSQPVTDDLVAQVDMERPPLDADIAASAVVDGEDLEFRAELARAVEEMKLETVQDQNGRTGPLTIRQSEYDNPSFALEATSTRVLAVSDDSALADSVVMVGVESTTSANLYSDSHAGFSQHLIRSVQEPINVRRVIEFVFTSGDTLSHGMSAAGLPTNLWPAIIDKVGTQFQPGEKLIFYSQDDQFEQLVVIRKKKPKTIIAADLTVDSAHAVKTQIKTVSGHIDTSLYAALINDLDESAIWRIAYRLKHIKVPLNTLPKGSNYQIQIEHIVGDDGETIRYGVIKSLRIDTQSSETSSKGRIYEYRA